MTTSYRSAIAIQDRLKWDNHFLEESSAYIDLKTTVYCCIAILFEEVILHEWKTKMTTVIIRSDNRNNIEDDATSMLSKSYQTKKLLRN